MGLDLPSLSPSHPPAPNPRQLLQSFEDIPLCSVLQQIQEKHDLQKVKKVRVSGLREIGSPGVGFLGPFSLMPEILF